MSLPTKKTPADFPFKHSGQADAYGNDQGGNTAQIQTNFDSRATYNQDEINALIDSLASVVLGDSGANAIGLNTADTVGSTVADELDLIRQAGSGTIPPDGSITNSKLATDVKVGSLASLTTTATSDVVSAINEVDANANALDNTINYGNTVSGTDTLTITTVNGGFTFAVGKSLRGIAVANNTGAMTVDVDGNGAKDIKKLDGSSYVAVEADDFENNKPFELIGQNDGTDFFLLAPKGGAVIKSVQHIQTIWNDTNLTKDVTISSVKTDNTLVDFTFESPSGNANQVSIGIELLNATTVRLHKNTGFSSSQPINIQVEEYLNAKSKQSGIKTIPGATFTEQTVTVSSVNSTKSILKSSHTTTVTSQIYLLGHGRIIDDTTLGFKGESRSYYWQLIEF